MSTSNISNLHVSNPSTGVTLIEIDAPPANALGHELRTRLYSELESVGDDLNSRVVVLTGRGKHFCTGDDLKEARQRGDDAASSLRQFGRLLDLVEDLRVPVIAAINGSAIGGGLELALACDVRIAGERASFTGAGVNVGLMASVYRLPRLVGVGPAKAMLLTGSPATSEQALRYGLVTEVVPDDELAETALALADRIATRAPLSVEAAKRTIGKAFDLSRQEADRVVAAELPTLSGSTDHRRALEAFAKGEKPTFERN